MMNSAKDSGASQANCHREHQQGMDECTQDPIELLWYPESYPKALLKLHFTWESGGKFLVPCMQKDPCLHWTLAQGNEEQTQRTC